MLFYNLSLNNVINKKSFKLTTGTSINRAQSCSLEMQCTTFLNRIIDIVSIWTYAECRFCNFMSLCGGRFVKGVEKKPTWRFRSDRSSEKNNLSKIEKTGGQSQRAEGSLAAPCFFNFWKIVFLGTPFPGYSDWLWEVRCQVGFFINTLYNTCIASGRIRCLDVLQQLWAWHHRGWPSSIWKV